MCDKIDGAWFRSGIQLGSIHGISSYHSDKDMMQTNFQSARRLLIFLFIFIPCWSLKDIKKSVK